MQRSQECFKQFRNLRHLKEVDSKAVGISHINDIIL
jgi:hypothetical protein